MGEESNIGQEDIYEKGQQREEEENRKQSNQTLLDTYLPYIDINQRVNRLRRTLSYSIQRGLWSLPEI